MNGPRSNRLKIVVGLDGSAPAEQALAWAVDAALAFGAEVVAVHSVGMLESAHAPATTSATETSAQPPKDVLVQLRHAVGHCLEKVETPPELRLIFEPGAPADALLRVAEVEKADLIVVGRRGHGEPYQLDLGSTSRSVAARGTVPVVVVPSSQSEG